MDEDIKQTEFYLQENSAAQDALLDAIFNETPRSLKSWKRAYRKLEYALNQEIGRGMTMTVEQFHATTEAITILKGARLQVLDSPTWNTLLNAGKHLYKQAETFLRSRMED